MSFQSKSLMVNIGMDHARDRFGGPMGWTCDPSQDGTGGADPSPDDPPSPPQHCGDRGGAAASPWGLVALQQQLRDTLSAAG